MNGPLALVRALHCGDGMKRVIASCLVGLAGCSFAVQPHRTLDARHEQPSVLPIVADSLLATAAVAAGIWAGTYQDTCDTSQWSCWPSNYHALVGPAILAASVFAVSALYGHSRYVEKPDPDSHASIVAEHVTIAAHAGDCATAAHTAAMLARTDPAAYGRLLGDTVVQACLLRVDDDQRRFVLDAIAREPARDLVRSPEPCMTPR